MENSHSQKVTAREHQRDTRTTQQQDGNRKALLTHNYFKCKWIKWFSHRAWGMRWIKTKIQSCAAHERLISASKTRTGSEWVDKKLHENGDRKRAGIAILASDKIDFKLNTRTKDKEGHYIIIKGPIHEEDVTTIK